MSVLDLQELDEIKGLLAKGKLVGVLTYGEIAAAVAELDLDEADIEELHAFFEKAEIELVEEDATVEATVSPRTAKIPLADEAGLTVAVCIADVTPRDGSPSFQCPAQISRWASS